MFKHVESLDGRKTKGLHYFLEIILQNDNQNEFYDGIVRLLSYFNNNYKFCCYIIQEIAQ